MSVDSTSNSRYAMALAMVEQTGRHVFLTGRAGTGKTTFLKELRERSVKRMIVVAPTGVAAINAGGVTIHSFFQLPFGLFLPGYTRKSKFRFGKDKIDIIRRLDLLVIDEVSMLRADLLDEISRVLQKYRRNSVPFGGVQLLLIGDLYQLSPIVKEEEWGEMRDYYPSPYFFDSVELKKAGFESVELTHIYRQTDMQFIYLLEKVRQRKLDSLSISILQSRYYPGFQPDDSLGYVTLTTHNYQSDRINYGKLEELPGEPYIYEAEIQGDFPESSYPTAFRMEIRVGAQVMFVRNNTEAGYYNGKIGKVVRCSQEKIWVDDGVCEVEVGVESWENKKYVVDQKTQEIKEEVVGEFLQFPLRLAWAITIHKSQGLTFDKVIIDAGYSFAPGQVYVALSRCRTLEGVILHSPIENRALLEDTCVDGFYAHRNFEPDPDHLSFCKREYRLEQLRDQFDFSGMWENLIRLQEVAFVAYRKIYSRLEADIRAVVFQFGPEIHEVSGKFIRQLYSMGNQSEEVLDERCVKAAVYFLEKLDVIVRPLIPRIILDVEGKSQVAALTKIKKELKTQLNEKLVTLQLLKNQKHFDMVAYLKAKPV